MNTASRLEGANKYFGTRILVSEVTARASGRTDLIPVAEIVVKGRQQSIEVWTPAPDMACNARVEYTSAYRLTAKGDPAAVGAFEGLEQQNADEPLVKHYVAQARSGRMTTRMTLEGK
jgi:adenylate cyclase